MGDIAHVAGTVAVGATGEAMAGCRGRSASSVLDELKGMKVRALKKRIGQISRGLSKEEKRHARERSTYSMVLTK